jgi:NADPH:quinone reductase-like Zn-dependent oxidoreductase
MGCATAIAISKGDNGESGFYQSIRGPGVLQYGDMPDPVAGPGQVVIDVVAASVNAANWRVRAGASIPRGSFP